jgi:hypothetical protein
MSPEKQELSELEKTNLYVFHGSESEIEEFEPRQAFNYVNGENIPDGEPAIFASSVAEYAILMAIVNKTNCPKGSYSSAGTSGDENGPYVMKYRASKGTLAQLKDDASGWVYVFYRNLFTKREKGGVEYMSTEKVIPTLKIKVGKQDLPQDIEITNL